MTVSPDKLIDGKAIAEALKKEIAAEVAEMLDKGLDAPHLAAIIVGDDGASKTYVASKEKACQSVGMTSSVYRLPESTSEKELLDLIDFLNKDNEVDGYIIQLPLPKHIDERKVVRAINPDKDVDGFTPYSIGLMQLGEPCFLPATPFGIMELLKRSGVETQGKNVVVLGRSNIVGTPISVMLSRKGADATVTMCHSKTKNIADITRQADILIVAIGKPKYLTADMEARRCHHRRGYPPYPRRVKGKRLPHRWRRGFRECRPYRLQNHPCARRRGPYDYSVAAL